LAECDKTAFQIISIGSHNIILSNHAELFPVVVEKSELGLVKAEKETEQ
jgi:hypothetical protein